MEQHIFYLSLITEGATDKESHFDVQMKSFEIKNFSFNDQKCIFEDWKK